MGYKTRTIALAVATAALLILSPQSTSAFESHLKMRIHKELIQNMFSKNFDILLSRVEKEQEKDEKIGANSQHLFHLDFRGL